MRSARRSPRKSTSTGRPDVGQSFLEFAISLVGVVMFIYVLLNGWVWLTGTIIGRQAAFQATRLEAGQVASAGNPVPYQRPPIRLIGVPSSAGGRSGPVGLDLIPKCEAGEPFIAEAERLLQDINTLKAQAEQTSAEVGDLAAQLKVRADEAQTVCPRARRSSSARRRCDQLQREMQSLQSAIDQKTAELDALMRQIQDTSDEAQRQVELAELACL